MPKDEVLARSGTVGGTSTCAVRSRGFRFPTEGGSTPASPTPTIGRLPAPASSKTARASGFDSQPPQTCARHSGSRSHRIPPEDPRRAPLGMVSLVPLATAYVNPAHRRRGVIFALDRHRSRVEPIGNQGSGRCLTAHLSDQPGRHVHGNGRNAPFTSEHDRVGQRCWDQRVGGAAIALGFRSESG